MRLKLSERLKDFGLTRIQKSAFIGDLNPQERDVLLNIIRKYVTSSNDRVDIFVICNKDLKLHKRITCFHIDNILIEKGDSKSKKLF